MDSEKQELIAHYKTALKNLTELYDHEDTYWDSDKEGFESLKRSYLSIIKNYEMMFSVAGIKRRDL